MPFPLSLTTAALAAACLLPAVPSAAPAPASATRSACGQRGYSYAGFQSPTAAYGVAARLAALATPRVESGHVAAWVGVGGLGMGVNGADEWVQVGIAGRRDGSQELYYEYARPGAPEAVFVSLGPVALGEAHDIAVQEAAARPGEWRVWVDRRRVSPPIVLPGSHGAWRPIATAESWDGGVRSCNRYRYGFAHLAIATRPGGGWQAFSLQHPIQDPGFMVSTRAFGFAAWTRPSS